MYEYGDEPSQDSEDFLDDQEALREAYVDFYDIVEPFVGPYSLEVEPLTTKATEEIERLDSELQQDGFTVNEIDFLRVLAICDAQRDFGGYLGGNDD